MVLLLVTLAAIGTVMGTQYVSAHRHCHGHHGHTGGYVSAIPSGGGGGMPSGGGGGGY